MRTTSLPHIDDGTRWQHVRQSNCLRKLTVIFVRLFLARCIAGGKQNFFGYPSHSCLVVCLILAATLPSHAQSPTVSCHGARQPRQVAELLFGRDVGGHVGVTERAWTRFVARELTPRFPDGLTITDAIGQWRAPAGGKTVREPAKMVEIVLPGGNDDDARIDAVVEAYRRQFRQHSVGVIVRTACVSF